jgi:hypothetical protein
VNIQAAFERWFNEKLHSKNTASNVEKPGEVSKCFEPCCSRL